MDYIKQYELLYKIKKNYGKTSIKLYDMLEKIINDLNILSVLDYGCGKSKLLDLIKKNKKIKIYRYDPAIKKYSKLTKNKTDFDLKKEFLRVKEFLNMETSTVHGSQAVRREVIQKLKKEHNIKITNKQYNDFFKVYERLKEVDSTVSNKLMKYNVFEEISNILDDSNIDETVNEMRNRLTEIYQKSVGDTERDISEFFRIE